MKITRKVYETRKQKIIDFFIGVGLFVLLNGVILALFLLNPNSTVASMLGFLPFIVNAVLILVFALIRHWIALGMLGTIAFLLALATLLGIIAGAVCLFMALSGQLR